jgi:hypothetical protein
MIRRKQHIIQLIRQKVNEIDNTAEVILPEPEEIISGIRIGM